MGDSVKDFVIHAAVQPFANHDANRNDRHQEQGHRQGAVIEHPQIKKERYFHRIDR